MFNVTYSGEHKKVYWFLGIRQEEGAHLTLHDGSLDNIFATTLDPNVKLSDMEGPILEHIEDFRRRHMRPEFNETDRLLPNGVKKSNEVSQK